MRSLYFDSSAASSKAAFGPPTLCSAFCASQVWWVGQLAAFFGHCKSPLQAAARHANRLCRKGVLNGGKFDIVCPPDVDGLLASSGDMVLPNFEQISYLRLKQLSLSSQRTTIYWPSAAFGRAHALWAGTDSIPNPQQMSHGLLCTSVWLHFLSVSPGLALEHWTSEQEIKSVRGAEDALGPIPDAIVEREPGSKTAIEVVGKYPANWIQHHVDQFERSDEFQGWELW